MHKLVHVLLSVLCSSGFMLVRQQLYSLACDAAFLFSLKSQVCKVNEHSPVRRHYPWLGVVLRFCALAVKLQ